MATQNKGLGDSTEDFDVIEGQSQIKAQQEFIDADFSVELRKIGTVKLVIQNSLVGKNQRQYWKIRVDQSGCEGYQVERSFSEFEWLVKQLRSNDISLILPSIAKGGVKTYYNTKLVKDQRTHQERRFNLNRFLHKLCLKKEVVESKPFQIFTHKGDHNTFQMLVLRYMEDSPSHKETIISKIGSGVANYVNKLLPVAFSTDKEMSMEFKSRFNDIMNDVTTVLQSVKQIHDSHQEYLECLLKYDEALVSADLEYNEQLSKLVHWVMVIAGEIQENMDGAARERNKDDHDKFKQHFDAEVGTYTEEIKEELKQVAVKLSQQNQKSSGKISKLFQEKFNIKF